MVNKKAWIRIFESFIAVIIIISVLLIIYPKISQTKNPSEYIYEIQKSILTQISINNTLREKILNNQITEQTLQSQIQNQIPPEFNYKIRICQLSEPCSLQKKIEKDTYVSERIIISTYNRYNPKKIKLFFWLKD